MSSTMTEMRFDNYLFLHYHWLNKHLNLVLLAKKFFMINYKRGFGGGGGGGGQL